MSRFRFNFGQDDKKKSRRDLDDVVLSNDRQPRYDSYSHEHREGDIAFDRPISMNAHRAEDARMNRNAPRPRAPEQDPYQPPNSHAFRRTQVNREDLQNDYAEQDNFLAMPLRYPQKQQAPEYEQRGFAPSRQQRSQNDVKNLRFWSNEDAETTYDDTEAETDRPSLVKLIVAITGLVFIGTVAWLTYRWISMPSYDTPPLIEAQTEPYRIRPQTPGGTDFPHQDKLIYNRLAPATEQPVERLLPQPEQATIMAPTHYHAQQAQPHVQAMPAEAYQQQQGHYQQQPHMQPALQQPAAQQYAQQSSNVAAYQPQHSQAQNYAPQAPTMQQPAQPYPQQASVVDPRHAPQQIQPQQGRDEYYAQEQAPQHHQQMAQNPAALMENPPEVAQPNPQNTPQNQLNAFVKSEQQTAAPVVDTTYYFLQLGTLINEDLAKKEKERLQKRYARELTNIEILIKPYIATDGSKKFRLVTKSVIQSRAAALDRCSRLGSVCKPVKN